MSRELRRIELLAPARDYLSAVDAVDCGADAIYIGASRFGARHAACNAVEDIARAADYAHRYGARVYATLNTLLFDEETDAARELALEVLAAGVDALIVQDAAYCRMGLSAELHASTQMFNATPSHARFLSECGFARVILERGLTLEQIREIASASDAEIECFVHGAICVGYSGRCFLSRSAGERSGNRGMCSQPCRLPYDLVDGRGRTLLRGKHLLSLRDLSLGQRVGDLLDAGVTSFKIEGRLKDRIYVRNTVSYYRRVIDEALAARPHLVRASSGVSRADFTPDLSGSFTRGGTEYYLDGKCRGCASFDTPKAVGEYLGRVASLDGGGFRLDGGGCMPSSGDGLCFVTSAGVVGTNVNGVDNGKIIPNRLDGISVGADVYRNFDRVFARTVSNARLRRSVEVDAAVRISPAEVSVTFSDDEGHEASAVSAGAFEPASDPSRMNDVVRSQISKTGDTMFDVRRIVTDNPSGLFVRASVLNDLRRKALASLLDCRTAARGDRRIFRENISARCDRTHLGPQDNVTNRLAEAFYRDHGVTSIERGLDLRRTMRGEVVMRTPYCLRREIGECLREGSTLHGDLYLCRGTKRYLLHFDCARCEMSLSDCSR